MSTLVFNLVLTGVIASAFLVMIFLTKKQDQYPAAKYGALAALAVILVCAALMTARSMSGKNDDERMTNNRRYLCSTSEVLADELARSKPGSKAVLIIDPAQKNNPNEKARIKVLEKHLSENGIEVISAELDIPEIRSRENMQKDKTLYLEPTHMLMKAKHFNKISEKHPDADLIISTLGLPKDAEKMSFWKQYEQSEGKITLALAECSLKNLRRIEPAIREGAVSAVVIPDPEAVWIDEPAPEDAKEAFEKRYILITPENIHDISSKYNIFPKK